MYYIIKNKNTTIPTNNTAIPTNNTEAFTHEEMEAVFYEDSDKLAISNENVDNYVDNFITDSDTDTDSTSDYDSPFFRDSDSDTSDIEGILDDPDLFFMPNVDFDVCPIEELKFYEFNSLYSKEIEAKNVTEEDIMDFIYSFSKEELATNGVNDLFVLALSLL
jgi:hypothetical protein